MAFTAYGPQSPASRPRKRLKISITPLIDVVFILLVFVMLASSYLDWRSISLRSVPDGGAAAGVEGAVLIELSPDGVRLFGERITLVLLGERIAERVAAKPEQRILVRPAQAVDMQRMVLLLDTLAAIGARNVSLMPGR